LDAGLPASWKPDGPPGRDSYAPSRAAALRRRRSWSLNPISSQRVGALAYVMLLVASWSRVSIVSASMSGEIPGSASSSPAAAFSLGGAGGGRLPDPSHHVFGKEGEGQASALLSCHPLARCKGGSLSVATGAIDRWLFSRWCDRYCCAPHGPT